MSFKHCIICNVKIKRTLYRSHYDKCRLRDIIQVEQTLNEANRSLTSVNENESSKNTVQLSGCENETSESESTIEDTNKPSLSKKKCKTSGPGGKVLKCEICNRNYRNNKKHDCERKKNESESIEHANEPPLLKKKSIIPGSGGKVVKCKTCNRMYRNKIKHYCEKNEHEKGASSQAQNIPGKLNIYIYIYIYI